MKFKNKKEYQVLRNILVTEATDAVDNGDNVKFEEIEGKINELDKEFQNFAVEEANKKSTLNNKLKNLQNDFSGGQPIGEEIKFDNKTAESNYLNAFGKIITGQRKLLTPEEIELEDLEFGKYKNAVGPTEVKDNVLVVPEEVFSNIWSEMEENHPVLADISPTNILGGTVIIMDDYEADGEAKWLDEGTDAKEDKQITTSIKLDNYEVAKVITLSWKMRKLGIAAFVDYISKKIAAKVGDALAEAVFIGKGVKQESDSHESQALGIITKLEAEVGKPQIITFKSAEKLTYENLTQAFSKIKSKYKNKAIYANSTMIWNDLANILDVNGRPIFIPDATQGSVGRIFGYPIKEESAVADDYIVIGDFGNGYIMNIAEDITIYVEDHVKKRTTDYMAYAMADGKPIATKAFALLKKITA